MAEDEDSISEVGLTELAEEHLKGAVDRLGKLVEEEDGRIALEASQLIIRLARPRFPLPGGGWPGGGWPGGGWVWPPESPWGDPWGGVRAG